MEEIIMKKFLSLLLCGAMLVSIASCGGKSENASSDVTAVTVWTGNGHDKAFLNEKISEWNETEGKKAGIRIDYAVQEGSMNEKLDLAFINGTAPDLFAGGNMNKMMENDQIIAIEELPGGDALVERFSEYIMDGRHSIDGKTYCLPKTTTTYGLIYNKQMFKDAGLVDENGEPTPPKTLDELREYAKILTDESKRQYGIIFPGKFGAWYSDDVMKMASASCGFVDGYNPATGKFDFSAQGAVMKTIMGVKADGSYYPGVENLDNDPARARFGDGGIGMKTAASYDFGVLTEQFPAKIEWGVAPFPVADENNKHLQYQNNGGYLKINKASVDKIGAEKLMKVFEWFHSEELMIEAYKNGIDIPVDWDLVKDVEIDDSLANWKSFAEIASISMSCPVAIATDVTGVEGIPSIWINQIWPEKISVDDIDATLEAYTQTLNEGIVKYQELHPEYDPSKVIISDWETKRED